MTFQIDDSNPDNPLKDKTPQDFGANSWLNLFITYTHMIEDGTYSGFTKEEQDKFVVVVVQVMLAYLVDNLTSKCDEGGDV